jgi:hypothetical protein
VDAEAAEHARGDRAYVAGVQVRIATEESFAVWLSTTDLTGR